MTDEEKITLTMSMVSKTYIDLDDKPEIRERFLNQLELRLIEYRTYHNSSKPQRLW